MKTGILSILLAIIVALIPCLSALADETGTITITMTGVSEISITLDKTEWPIGNVASDEERLTEPSIDWCTLKNEGNVNVNTCIVGEDAQWYKDGVAQNYYWTLITDESHVSDDERPHEYALWFRVHGDNPPEGRGYVLIRKTESELWPWSGGGSSIGVGDTKQFGLKLLTPTFFYAGREMKTPITISAVAA